MNERSDEGTEYTTPTLWYRPFPSYLFLHSSWTCWLGERLGNSFAELQAQDLKVRTILDEGGKGGIEWACKGTSEIVE